MLPHALCSAQAGRVGTFGTQARGTSPVFKPKEVPWNYEPGQGASKKWKGTAPLHPAQESISHAAQGMPSTQVLPVA